MYRAISRTRDVKKGIRKSVRAMRIRSFIPGFEGLERALEVRSLLGRPRLLMVIISKVSISIFQIGLADTLGMKILEL